MLKYQWTLLNTSLLQDWIHYNSSKQITEEYLLSWNPVLRFCFCPAPSSQDPELYRFITIAAKAASHSDISNQYFLVSKYWVQQSTPPCWLSNLFGSCQQSTLEIFYTVSCCIDLPEDY